MVQIDFRERKVLYIRGIYNIGKRVSKIIGKRMFYFALALTALVLVCVLVAYIEEKDMREINNAYLCMDMTDPLSVCEYLQLLASKPQWRVGLIVSSILGFVCTALFIYSRDCGKIPTLIYFLMTMMTAWILMIAYISFFSFHIIQPNGGQELCNKLRYPNSCAEMKYGK